MSQRKMVWEVAEAPFYSERLASLLDDGWEPFAVIRGEPVEFNDRVVLRRFVAAVKP